jgi:hypothetical protein
MSRFRAQKPPRAVRHLGLIALLVALSGCAAVKPWQRECLAKPKMALDADPEAALLEQHVYLYREGSAGGYGGSGGGCGCN